MSFIIMFGWGQSLLERGHELGWFGTLWSWIILVEILKKEKSSNEVITILGVLISRCDHCLVIGLNDFSEVDLFCFVWYVCCFTFFRVVLYCMCNSNKSWLNNSTFCLLFRVAKNSIKDMIYFHHEAREKLFMTQ